MANGIFNAEQYLELYPALVEAGITVDTAWDHYAAYGAGELRAPNTDLDGKVYAASVLNYANANEDVAEYFGIETPATSLTQQQNADVMLQYVLYGSGEERDAKIIDAPVIVDDSDLLEALNAYQDAKAAEKDALKEAAKVLKLDDDADADAVKGAVDTKAEDINTGKNSFGTGGTSDTDIEKLIKITDFNNDKLSLAVRQQLIEAKEDTLNAQLAQEANKLSSKELNGAKAYAKAVAAESAANANSTKAQGVASAEAAALGSYTGLTTTVEVNADKELELKAGGTVIGTYNKGKLELSTDSANKADVDKIKAADNFKAFESAFVEAGKANEKANDAEKNVATITEKYTIGEGADAKTPDDYGAKYIEASNAVEAFKALTKSYNEAAQQQQNVEAAGKNVDAAVKALKDLGYDVAEDGFGTDGNDLFIYEADKDAQYFEFGAEGDDVFFFGTQFNFVELKATDNFEKGNFGDKDAFEIFAQQDGNDVVLYVETKEVGGNATGLEDVDTITLVGVDLADLSFHGGFLTVA